MRFLLRTGMLMLAVWLGLSGASFAKQVYFRDGSVLECESVWRQNGLVFVKVNRDVVLEFAPAELDLRRGMRQTKQKVVQAKRKRSHAGAGAVAAASAVTPTPASAPAQEVKQVAAKTPAAAARTADQPVPAVPPATVAAAVPAVQPDPAPDAAGSQPSPLTKEEYERRTKENTAAMAEAIKKGDSELVKKALDEQKELVRRQREAANAPGPDGLRPEPPWYKYFLMMIMSGLFIIIGMWGIFRKAGHLGVKSIVPVYNYYVLMQIAGKPGWWCLLAFVPVVGLATHLLAMLALAERFQRSAAFGIGLVLLPMIFFPLLAFGGARVEEVREDLNFTFSEEPPKG